MPEMLAQRRRYDSFRGFRPDQRAADLRDAAAGTIALCLLVAGASVLAASEHALAIVDFIAP